jgi:iron complex outermembrane receptor protein
MNNPNRPLDLLSNRVRWAALCLAVLGAGLGQVATAQQSPAATASGAGLEEIIVTAQKRAQNSQDVGIAISAVSGADLTELGAVTASDITKAMPAVVLTQPNGPASFSLSIRGVTQNDFADHQESPAAIYVDDVYVSQMSGLAFSMFDMDRVEVLRGPQGTLFGRNATGGLANFVTRRPTSEVGGFVNVSFGEYNLTRVEGAINGAVADGIDARISFLSNHYDPLFTNIAGGAPNSENGSDWAVRGQLLFQDLGGGQLLLNARTSREDVHAGAWEQYATAFGTNGENYLIGPQDNYWGTCPGCNASGIPSAAKFTTTDNRAGFAKIKTKGLTAKYTHDLAFATLTAIGDYSTLTKNYQEDSDVTPYTIFQFFNGSDVNQSSIELRLNGEDQKLNWTAGAYGLHIDGNYYDGWEGPAFFGAEEFNYAGNPNAGYSGYSVSPGPWPYSQQPYPTGCGCPGYVYGGQLAQADPNGGLPATKAPYSLTTNSYAIFGQVEYRFTDLIGLTLGARFTNDRKDYSFSWYPYEYYPQSTTGQVRILTRPIAVPLSQDYNQDRSDNLWAGKAQVDFHLAPSQLLYVSYNRGVKGGGFTAPLFPATIANPSDLSFKPEELTSYELGLKSEFLDHTLRINSAVYYYDYHDYQALIYTVSLNQLIKNADATHKGVETEMDWAPDKAWRFGLGVAYVDAVVKNVPALCCTANFEAITADYTPANAPKWSGNAMIRYTLPVGGGDLALQADGNYLSKFWFNLGDAPSVEQDAYGIYNARVSYVPSGGKFEIGASVENIADKHYATMGFDNTGVNGLAQRYPGMPRWFKAHVNYRF